MTRMYPNTRKALEEAGWYPGRCIDSIEFEQMLQEGGYEPYEPVIAFYREFGGLRISERYGMEPREEHITYIYGEPIDFNYKIKSIKSLETYVMESVFEVGETGNGTEFYITASGKILGRYESFLGDDVIDGFNHLVYNLGCKSLLSMKYWCEKSKGIIHGKTYELLQKAGWYPGRQIDTSELERAMGQMNCESNPAALEFYREFGDLRVYSEKKHRYYHISSEYLKFMAEPFWKECREYLGETATIIGAILRDDLYYEKKECVAMLIIVTKSFRVHGYSAGKYFKEIRGEKWGDGFMEAWEKALLSYGKEGWYESRIEKEMEEYFAEHPE